MKASPSLKIKTIIVLALVVGMQPILRDLLAEADLFRKTGGHNRFTILIEKLSGIKAGLEEYNLKPFSKIGFFMDVKDGGLYNREIIGMARIAIGPLIVVQDTDQEKIVAYFQNAIDIDKFCREKGLRLLKDFNNGIFLLENPGN